MWNNKRPQIKYFKVFGVNVVICDGTIKMKFDGKSYWQDVKTNGYKVRDVLNEKYIVVRDVIENETNFLLSKTKDENEEISSNNSSKTDVSDKSK